MRNLLNNNYGSIVPLVTFFLVLLIVGILGGIFINILSPIAVLDSNMDTLMWRAYIFCFVIVFIVVTSWLIMKGQKSGYTGGI